MNGMPSIFSIVTNCKQKFIIGSFLQRHAQLNFNFINLDK